jgi:hypothetical protein
MQFFYFVRYETLCDYGTDWLISSVVITAGCLVCFYKSGFNCNNLVVQVKLSVYLGIWQLKLFHPIVIMIQILTEAWNV